jgi:AcrR family transcriptional regulator
MKADGRHPRDMKQTFTIAELVALSGVPAATIHYYLRQDLLPSPKRLAPNRFVYDQRHVQGLKLIRTLREQRELPLPMIKRILPELLRLEAEEAFRPEMWDRALEPRISRTPSQSLRLLKAAKELFSHRSYAEVNVDLLCRAARMAKGSFYRYYLSKEQIFLAAAESLADEVVDQFRNQTAGEPDVTEDPTELLARQLRPRLPVFLELLSRVLRGRPADVEAARATFDRMVSAVGAAVAGEGSALERGMSAVSNAMAIAIRRALAEDPGAVATPGPEALKQLARPDGQPLYLGLLANGKT